MKRDPLEVYLSTDELHKMVANYRRDCAALRAEVSRLEENEDVLNDIQTKLDDENERLREELSHEKSAREKAEGALCRAREALERIAACDWVKGGRIIFGNEELSGDAGQFYRGYNAGIKGQFETTKVIANAAFSSSSSCPHEARVKELEEAVKANITLIHRAQDALTGYLVPDGIDSDKAMEILLELLDGPRQREAQRIAYIALKAKVNGVQNEN